MQKIMEFEIPFKLPSLNEYINSCRGNRYAGAKQKKEIEQYIGLAVGRLEPITEPVYVHFTWYEQTSRRDKDNVCFAKKFALDFLQKAGVLPNDNNRYILGFKDDFVYHEGQKVVVELWQQTKNV